MTTPDPPEREDTIWPPPPTQGHPPQGPAPSFSPERYWVFWQIAGRMTLMGLGLGALCGAGFGLCVLFLIGAVYGLIFGAVAGFILGVVDGLLLAIVTCSLFFPLTQSRGYRAVAVGTVILVTLCGGWLLSIRFFGGGFSGLGVWLPNVTAVVPPGIAAIAAGLAARKTAVWYEAAFGIRN